MFPFWHKFIELKKGKKGNVVLKMLGKSWQGKHKNVYDKSIEHRLMKTIYSTDKWKGDEKKFFFFISQKFIYKNL